MKRGQSKPLDDLLQRDRLELPLYMDGAAIPYFLEWLEEDNPNTSDRLNWLLSGIPNIYIFYDQLGTSRLKKYEKELISDLGITFISKQQAKVHNRDDAFVDELLKVYFHNLPNAIRLTKLLILARRQSEDQPNREISIISQYGGFDRVPDVNVYYFPSIARLYHRGFPVNFDFLQDFEIHPAIANAIQSCMNGTDYPLIVNRAYYGLELHVQSLTGLIVDGGTLMNDALNSGATPRLQMNQLTDRSTTSIQQNEQDGMYRLLQASAKLFRNPMVHQGGPLGTYALSSRFDDQITAFKVVIFLSYLCERLDRGNLPL